MRRFDGYILDCKEYTGPSFLRPVVFLIARFFGWRPCKSMGSNWLIKNK